MRRQLTMKENQDVSLEILHTIAEICEEQQFRYFLIYGTLIGAIRHKDYIPWDDDVDIMMPRQDYDALLYYLKDHISQYPHLQVFNRAECDSYPYMITRISDDRYEIVMDNEKPYGMGVFIDVYPFDGAGDEWSEAVKFAEKGDRLSSMCFQATRTHFTLAGTASPIKKLIKLPAFLLAKMIGKEYFQDKLAKLAGVKPYDESKYVCCVVWMTNGAKEVFEREWFDEYVMVQFGKYNFRAPKEYDKVLSHNYGNYMQLPPESERVGHHFYSVYEK